jgi:upstream activation factor subunit UAF30
MTSSTKKPAPAKGATPAKAAPKAAAAKAAKPATASAFAKPLQPSKELAAVVGAAPLPRTEVVSKVWEYIKKHKLQNEANKREIIADEKLKAVFGRDKVTMFEMNKYLAQHLK